MKTVKNSAENPGTVDLDAAKKAASLLESEYGAKDISVQCLYCLLYTSDAADEL